MWPELTGPGLKCANRVQEQVGRSRPVRGQDSENRSDHLLSSPGTPPNRFPQGGPRLVIKGKICDYACFKI